MKKLGRSTGLEDDEAWTGWVASFGRGGMAILRSTVGHDLVGQGQFPEILWMRFDSLLLCLDIA